MPTQPKRASSILRRVSLRFGLGGLVLLVLAFLVVDRSAHVAAERRDKIERSEADVLAATKAAADRQSNLIAQAKTTLRLVVALPSVVQGARLACNRALANITDSAPWLRNVAIFGLDGAATCSSADQTPTQSFADRAYFQTVLKTRDFALSDYIIGRVSGLPIVVLAYPVMAGDSLRGVAAAAIDLDWLSRIAAETPTINGAETLLVDRNATVFAAYPEPENWVGRELRDQSAFVQILHGSETSVRTAELDGVESVIGHARLAATDAVLAVVLPLDRVTDAANAEARAEYAKIAIGGAIWLIAIWLGGEFLVIRPIRVLTKGAERLGGGHFLTGIDTDRLPPELSRLGESFNAMGEQLHEREVELRQANARLTELATTDPLTHLANRRAFDERLQSEWSRARREDKTVGLLIIDIDYFKQYNDTYGHSAGDDCLQQVARTLRRTARRGADFVARLGGEEFAVLLPGADLAACVTLAELIRNEVEALDIRHDGSPIGHVTISIGAAAQFADATSTELFDQVDAALYRAKHDGRNRVALQDLQAPLVS